MRADTRNRNPELMDKATAFEWSDERDEHGESTCVILTNADGTKYKDYHPELLSISVVFDGALDEEFDVLAEYADEVVDEIAKQIREDVEANSTDAIWTVDAYDASGTPVYADTNINDEVPDEVGQSALGDPEWFAKIRAKVSEGLG